MRHSALVVVVGGLATSALLVLGPGIAAADVLPDVIGKTYGEAKGMISEAKMKAIVATVVGDRLPQDQCHVMSLSKKTFLDSSGEADKTPTVYVDLSCYKEQADDSHPGFSAANLGPSAEAVRTADAEEVKKWLQGPKGKAFCEERYQEHPDWPPEADDCALYYPYLVEEARQATS